MLDPRVQKCAGTSFVLCYDKKWTLAQRCPGPNGCTEPGGGLVTCDPNGAFVAGDPCRLIQYACTGDDRQQLECKDGTFVAHDCPGLHGCSGITCDLGVAKQADPCVLDQHTEACSDDKKSLLECKVDTKKKKPEEPEEAPKWMVKKTCKAGCTPDAGALRCD
jgi:hypothetical protein